MGPLKNRFRAKDMTGLHYPEELLIEVDTLMPHLVEAKLHGGIIADNIPILDPSELKRFFKQEYYALKSTVTAARLSEILEEVIWTRTSDVKLRNIKSPPRAGSKWIEHLVRQAILPPLKYDL